MNYITLSSTPATKGFPSVLKSDVLGSWPSSPLQAPPSKLPPPGNDNILMNPLELLPLQLHHQTGYKYKSVEWREITHLCPGTRMFPLFILCFWIYITRHHCPSHLSSDILSKSTPSPIFTVEFSHYSPIMSNRLSPCVWGTRASSQCVLGTPHHQPIIRISADDPAGACGTKSKLLFLDPLLLFLSPPPWTKPVIDVCPLWAKRANSFIYIYECKTHSTLPLKQCKWNWVALLISLSFYIPKTLW